MFEDLGKQIETPIYVKNIFNTNIKTYTFIQSLHQTNITTYYSFFPNAHRLHSLRKCERKCSMCWRHVLNKYTNIKLYMNVDAIPILVVILYYIDPYSCIL